METGHSLHVIVKVPAIHANCANQGSCRPLLALKHGRLLTASTVMQLMQHKAVKEHTRAWTNCHSMPACTLQGLGDSSARGASCV